MIRTLPSVRPLLGLCLFAGVGLGVGAIVDGREPQLNATASALVRQYCLDCHAGKTAEAKLDLAQMVSAESLAADFTQWRTVAAKVRNGEMPPADSEQLTAPQRKQLLSELDGALDEAVRRHAGEPGRVVLRRLTAAEQNYTLRDLTGLDLDFAPDIADAVGGEGFTNIGLVQFVQASTLEQYLAAAKQVAEHAVIGAGPIRFYSDPGQTGFELAAINRIQEIYRDYGFRTAAGEGGEPYGLDRYPNAFLAAWEYRHRSALGKPDATLADVARPYGLTERFVAHIWEVLNQEEPDYPATDLISAWRAFPVPSGPDPDTLRSAKAASDALFQRLKGWYGRLATSNDDEAAPVLVEDVVRGRLEDVIKVRVIWPEESATAPVSLQVTSADATPDDEAVAIWHSPEVRFRSVEGRRFEWRPLREVLDEEAIEQFNFGRHPHGTSIGKDDFVTTGTSPVNFTMSLPEGMRSAELVLRVSVDPACARSHVVRCSASAGLLAERGKVISTLLADPETEHYQQWFAGVSAFARSLPQISHREPAPSDRDPIPAPFDNTYNMPERDYFHYKVKYFRDDSFLQYYVLDDAGLRALELAWADLLSSFEYHDVYLKFVAQKFGFAMPDGMAAVDAAWMRELPVEAQEDVARLHSEYTEVQELRKAGFSGHLEDVLAFASRAWRRPLEVAEQDRLRAYYQTLRTEQQLDHVKAIRALLARTLVAPDFIYRIERPRAGGEDTLLSDWELASRLSYFLWSSLPDAELRRAAAAGELRDPRQLAGQAERLLRDAKSRRLAAEFFGQWLGFYRFDQYRGVDAERFPEFTDELKRAMHEEAVTFFDYLVRHDRPLRELLFADYAFLNRPLAEHYGVEATGLSEGTLSRVEDIGRFQRGGLFGLGAVLTSTSAPLRTSAVKRGDWILRRVVGTPVPPPPADAGSIPADDVQADGLTVRERLEAHRQNPSCQNCHVRIDPLGFALENYDAIGRWRDQYRGGQPIDASGTLHDGTRIEGPAGLRSYLEANEREFFQLLCTKLLGYGLGRRASVADMQLVDEISADLQAGGSFAQVVEKIVTSRQFRYHQGRAK